MTIYRLASGEYKKDLSGNGSRLYGGRWNSVGMHAVYCTENISLAVLEILVNLKKFKQPADYHIVTITIPDHIKPAVIMGSRLKKGWKDDYTYSQYIGDEFLRTQQSLFLKVPSAIVEPENNFIINPRHPDSGKVKITSTKIFEFDKRLQLTNE
ncbi:MAG: RES family NAD+ phosphorylase [Ferruginibacter sp.]|nr:RES family NAD+ phosphorylase [Ferruginibacter sp.]